MPFVVVYKYSTSAEQLALAVAGPVQHTVAFGYTVNGHTSYDEQQLHDSTGQGAAHGAFRLLMVLLRTVLSCMHNCLNSGSSLRLGSSSL